jgi:hypothetical protein
MYSPRCACYALPLGGLFPFVNPCITNGVTSSSIVELTFRIERPCRPWLVGRTHSERHAERDKQLATTVRAVYSWHNPSAFDSSYAVSGRSDEDVGRYKDNQQLAEGPAACGRQAGGWIVTVVGRGQNPRPGWQARSEILVDPWTRYRYGAGRRHRLGAHQQPTCGMLASRCGRPLRGACMPELFSALLPCSGGFYTTPGQHGIELLKVGRMANLSISNRSAACDNPVRHCKSVWMPQGGVPSVLYLACLR